MPSHDSSIFVDFRGEMVNNVIWKVAPKEFNGERYSRKSPFVFVGGHPRSGTTLMRSMFGWLTVAPYDGHFCPCRPFSLFSVSLSVLKVVISTVHSTLYFKMCIKTFIVAKRLILFQKSLVNALKCFINLNKRYVQTKYKYLN